MGTSYPRQAKKAKEQEMFVEPIFIIAGVLILLVSLILTASFFYFK
jgi:hypothetical protein